jgi:hypothetical protein
MAGRLDPRIGEKLLNPSFVARDRSAVACMLALQSTKLSNS